MAEYLRGIDVSGHQGDIDWKLVAGDGIKFAYCKSSEGATFKAASYAPNRAGARTHGIVSGAYHFAQLGKSPQQNCANFLAAIADYQAGDLLPALDVEEMGIPAGMSGAERQAWMIEFAKEFAKSKPWPLVLYGASKLAVTPELLQHFPYLWCAKWSAGEPKPKTWPTWSIWQYQVGKAGTVSGVSTEIDCDYIRPEDLPRLRVGGGASGGVGDVVVPAAIFAALLWLR